MSEQLTIIPQKWIEAPEPGGAEWVREHAKGLCRVWPSAPETIERVAREVGVSWKLLVTRMEIEQSAVSYAWDGKTRDYWGDDHLLANWGSVIAELTAQGVATGEQDEGDPTYCELAKLYYLCGADKTDGGPRKGGWFGPERQLLACALRFRFWYRGQDGARTVADPIGEGLANHYVEPVPEWRNWLGRREDPAFRAGVPVTRGGDTIIPSNQASADCLRYTTALSDSRRLSGIGKRWFPDDYRDNQAPEGGDNMGKVICLDAGHVDGGGAQSKFGGASEGTLNGRIVRALVPMLEAMGHTVYTSPRSEKGVSAIGRWSAGHKPDVFLSIHHNAGGGRGAEAYCAGEEFGGADVAPNGKSLATSVVNAVMAAFGLPAHGQAVRTRWIYNGKPARLGVLSGGDNWAVAGAAALIEMAFVDNAADSKILQAADYPENAARALFRGIQAYLKQPATVPDPGTNVPTEGTLTKEDTRAWNLLVRATQQFLCNHGHTVVVDGWLGRETLGAAEDLQEALP